MQKTEKGNKKRDVLTGNHGHTFALEAPANLETEGTKLRM